MISWLINSQNTNVPDDNFENYLETHDASGNTVNLGDVLSMGNGIANDDTVTTANINTVTTLSVAGLGISELTGIEDFASLTELNCGANQLTSLDVSNNTALTNLGCSGNQLTNLDVSNNTLLTIFHCASNQLESLNVKNGNNGILFDLVALNNPNLFCIDVDDVTFAEMWWHNIDSQSFFSEDCSALAINEFELDGFRLFPNPIIDNLTTSIHEQATYSIFNINGQFLKEGNLTKGESTVDLSNISSGLYFIKVETEEGTLTKKLIKQ
jgi:Leucine-rich repeat (LRR) protein